MTDKDRRKHQTPDHPLRRGSSPPFKDSQLDEIERLASPNVEVDLVSSTSATDERAFEFTCGETIELRKELFQPGGLYYEMRRENEQLRERTLSHCDLRALYDAAMAEREGWADCWEFTKQLDSALNKVRKALSCKRVRE